MKVSLLCYLSTLMLSLLALVATSSSAILAMTVPDLDWEETTFHEFRMENSNLAKERTIKSFVCLSLVLAGGILTFAAGICGVVTSKIDLHHVEGALNNMRAVTAMNYDVGRQPTLVVPDVTDVPDVPTEEL